MRNNVVGVRSGGAMMPNDIGLDDFDGDVLKLENP
jgi:hypothetical protein